MSAPQATTPVQAHPEAHSALSRRRFLGLAGGASVLAALGATLGPRAWDAAFGSSSSVSAGASDAKTLVLVTLYGGNDGVNMVVPYQDPAYAAQRGALAIPASQVLPLADGFGLHPGMSGLQKLWKAGQLAVVHGVGFADPNYSHFESMDIWQSGVPEDPVSTGWLGRWMDATNQDPLVALGVGPTLLPALAGEKVQGVTVPPGKLVLPGGPAEQSGFAGLGHTYPAEPLLDAATAGSEAELLVVDHQLGPIVNRAASAGSASAGAAHAGAGAAHASAGAAHAGAGAGAAHASAGAAHAGAASNPLALQLSIVANLILGGAPSRVYGVEFGGFDTHAAQLDTQDRLLAQLDSAVSSFVDAVSASPAGRQTVVLVYTEFGRRLSANASGGTDHGWANPVLVAGAPVHGGFYGEPPSLTNLSLGNAIYTTDFRSVYATMFGRVLGVDPTSFLDGSFKDLAFV